MPSLVDDARLLKERAEIYEQEGDYEKALAYYREALKRILIFRRKMPKRLVHKYLDEAIVSLKSKIDTLSKIPPKKIAPRKSQVSTKKVKTKKVTKVNIISVGGSTSLKIPAHTRPKIPTSHELSKVSKSELPDVCPDEVISTERPNVNFKDIAGLDDLKKDLREAIEWPIKYSDKMKQLKISPIKGVLLLGPPGCGKTFLVRCAAGEFGVALLIASPSAILSKYVGESEKMVSKMFSCASALAPSIIFVDEVDKFLPLKSEGTDASKRVENQFLQEMDGIKSGSGFITVMATNEPWNINPALIRPGRVDRIVYVPPPDERARKKLFEIYLEGIPTKGINYDKLAKMTAPNEQGYYSSAAIKTICDEVKRTWFREWIEKKEEFPVTMDMIKDALKKVKRSITHEMVEKYKEWARKYASEIG